MQGDKNVEVMRQRDRYVDVAKGIAMLLIVSIHTEGFGVFGYPLAFVAVPIFFFMSGFYDRSERDFMVWLPKALRTLILPAVVWIVVATLYAQLLGYAKDRSWGDLPFDWYNIAGSNGPAWFLFALLYAKLLVWAMLKAKLPKTILGGNFCHWIFGHEGQHAVAYRRGMRRLAVVCGWQVWLSPHEETFGEQAAYGRGCCSLVGILQRLLFVYHCSASKWAVRSSLFGRIACYGIDIHSNLVCSRKTSGLEVARLYR